MPDGQRAITPALDALEDCFRVGSPVFRDAVANSRAALGESWAVAFNEAIKRVTPERAAKESAVAGYARFALEALRLQARFERDRVYLPRTFEDVRESVYGNEAYMTGCYLPGLLLSHYLWPHHYRQLRFFETAFVPQMETHGGRFTDVGVGTGMYSRAALTGAPSVSGLGLDVSPWSRAFAEGHVLQFAAANRYHVDLRDVVEVPGSPTDWLISVEVLEHLEQPVTFLRGLRSMLRVGGKAFIGTALNAANADHIYLYRTTDDVRAQLTDAGFAVEQMFAATAGPPHEPGVPVPEVAAFIVT